ncbi:40S ribosomal protein S6 [Sciurus carolinensis]|uniref:40S ribosomal protein S6 n=1 Tax=Sciurus carolinensis TaxID=30640 RepID=A0AA41MM70_SCICA|nr:40S ribosomal protein S6 [Sciurus carolinensis]
MKLNISFPVTGCQKLTDVDKERKLRTFYEKHMASEVAANALGEEWKDHVVQISGGNDKQGFLMKQGVLTHGRKKGEKDIPGLTDTTVPCQLGPKRVSKSFKLFNLFKEDDVHQYIVRKSLNREGKKPRTNTPKIQCLVTPRVLQHKRQRIVLKKQHTKRNKEEAAEYAKLLAKTMKEAKEKHQELPRDAGYPLRASTSTSESSQN